MALIVACDIHPINNLRVLSALRSDLSASDAMVQKWVARWIGEGSMALETMVSERRGTFCFGEQPTIADCCPIPQVYNARRFGVDLSPYPKLVAIEAGCLRLDAFDRARPELQPDADGASAWSALRALDGIDRKLLAELQRDASISHAELAERVGASTASCWRRIRALEADGVLGRHVRLVNSARIGRGVRPLPYTDEKPLGRGHRSVRELRRGSRRDHRMLFDVRRLRLSAADTGGGRRRL